MKYQYISHTHWDREWYRSENEFKARLYLSILSIVEELEKNKSFKYFVLDGQTEILETIEVLDKSLVDRIKKLVIAEKLLIGPWYTQPDMNLVDAESIINNLLIGQKISKSYGNCMNVLWNPDTFFQSPLTPRFVNEFSLIGVFAWRNFSQDNLKDFTFIWEGIDSSKCKAVTFPLGYGYSRYLNKNLSLANEEQLNYIKDIKLKFPNHKNEIFLMGGSDHARIDPTTSKFINKFENYEFSNPQLYIEKANFDNASTFVGMPTSFKGGRIHLGIGSTRIDIKQYNLKQQVELAKVVSPLNCIISHLGGENMNLLIEKAWKELHKNQFHDSVYSSSPEKVNEEVLNRYLLNEQLISEIKYLLARHIIKNYHKELDEKNEYVVMFNPTPFKKKCDYDINIKSQYKNIAVFFEENNIDFKYREDKYEIDYETKDYMGLTSLAGKYQVIEDSGVEFGEKYEHFITVTDFEMPPMGYKIIEISESDVKDVVILDKKVPQIDINDNIISIYVENQKVDLDVTTVLDEGDSYNFSSNDNMEKEQFQLTTSNHKEGKFTFTNLEQQLELALTKLKDAVKINVSIISQREDVMTTLNIGLVTENPKAVIHYLFDECNFYDKYSNIDWKKEKYVEKPLPIYLFNRLISAGNFEICTNSCNEFHYEEEKIKLVLLRSIGFMGKKNLNYRPGRASGYILETPKSQIKSKINHEIYITLPQKSTSIANKELIKPEIRQVTPTVFENYSNNFTSEYSLFEINNKDVMFETAKMLETGILIRLSSPNNEQQAIDLSQFSKKYMSNFAEERLCEIEENEIIFNDVITLILIK